MNFTTLKLENMNFLKNILAILSGPIKIVVSFYVTHQHTMSYPEVVYFHLFGLFSKAIIYYAYSGI